jgi:hypothetical protein
MARDCILCDVTTGNLNIIYVICKSWVSYKYCTFMLPRIVIDCFLNNHPDALIIPILFCYNTLHVPGIFCARHQEFSTVHSARVSFMQVGTGSSILTLLGSGHQTPAWNLPVPNVQYKTPVDGQRRCPKHVEFYNNKIGVISASGYLFKKKYL